MARKEVLHKFTVRPKNILFRAFPFDMLRYDRCHPASESDSSVITMCSEPRKYRGPKSTIEDYEVSLVRYAHKQWRPTEGRWESFGWEVIYEN